MATNNAWNNVIAASGGNISFNTGLTIDSTGRATNSKQPAFYAYLNTSVTNVTGDGTVYTLLFDSTRFNQGTVYNTANGTFTAPVAGRYLIGAYVNPYTFTAAATSQFLKLVTTNDTFRFNALNPGAAFITANQGVIGGCVLANMNASDTATVTYVVSGTTKSINIFGRASSGSEPGTYFYAYLVC